jgi:hypothetical protein
VGRADHKRLFLAFDLIHWKGERCLIALGKGFRQSLFGGRKRPTVQVNMLDVLMETWSGKLVVCAACTLLLLTYSKFKSVPSP